MPLSTDLSVSPYFDNYNPTKDYYKILFRPGVAVQVRELNELQTMFQTQIERFGDNIFKRGTIIDGCNFSFYNPYPYVKLVDTELDGAVAVPSTYVGHYMRNNANLVSFVVNYQDGFESTSPDLKTVYVKYINSGNTGEETAYKPNETLTIFNPNNVVQEVIINNGGSGFSNTDYPVFVSALVVNVSSGTFSPADQITNLARANSTVVSVDTTTLAKSNQVIISIKPLSGDLTSSSSTANNWTFANGDNIQVTGNPAIAGTIEGIIGFGANGVIRTDSTGKISSFTMTTLGNEYTTLPTVTIKSPANPAGVSSLSLSPKSYLARIKIPNSADAIGNGYAFGVTEGVIYQRGYFERVSPQTIIVSKYNQTPNNVVVGFTTVEEIIDSNIDTSLLDNALGTENENAPGADRLKLVPQLQILAKEVAEANNDFFELVEWSEGNPYKQNRLTAYNKIGDEMADRTSDATGDYVTNKFKVTTRSPANNSYEGTVFSVVVDPGTAYISGYKVETTRNFVIDVPKGLDTKTTNNSYISIDYGKYIRIKEVGGLFQFSTGDTIDFYSTAKGFLSNSTAASTGNTSPAAGAVKIGSARIRSMLHESGVAGTPDATYQLYLFNIEMLSGYNIKNAKSVYYDGTYKGIADIIQDTNPVSLADYTDVKSPKNDRMLFFAGVESLKNANNITYRYRTIDQTATFANTGLLVKSISANPSEFFPYSGNLSSVDMLNDLYVVPLSNNITAKVALAGTANSVSGNSILDGTGTSFLSELKDGDYVYISANSTGGGDVRRVLTRSSNGRIRLDSNSTFTNSSAKVYRYFPKNIPIPFGGRDGLIANVDSNRNIMTLNLGTEFNGPSVTTALAVNIERTNTTHLTKSPQRDKYVRIKPSNNATGEIKASKLSGKISFVAGNSTITGVGTNFTDDLPVGTTFVAEVYTVGPTDSNAKDDPASYKQYISFTVSAVANDTSLTVSSSPSVPPSTSTTNVAYGIPGSFNGPWCLGVSDVFRLKHVYIGSNNTFTGTETDVIDAVGNFYVDHNQNANYYDLSYLYMKPGAGLKLKHKDVLLVQFDYFTGGTGGFYITPSYISSNAAQIAINDSMSLSDLSSTQGAVSTYEIPEVNEPKGGYYDLLRYFDFRPSPNNTVTPSSSAGSAPINPSYQLNFGATSNPANDKKFPIPGSSIKANIEQYVGRTDSVFVGKDGKITVVKGNPDVNPAKRYEPNKSADSLRLNNLIIPPYPSIPKSISSRLARVLNTRVANERFSQIRNKKSIIETPFTDYQIEIEQPSGYTMAEIGNLERRIADLEYYTSLSLLETDVKDRVIPSSVDRSKNRFKFGFFADDFSTTISSDLEHPAYAAAIEDDKVVPPKQEWTVYSNTEGITCDYDDYLIISQNNATYAVIVITTPIRTTMPITTPIRTTMPITTPIRTTMPITTPIRTTDPCRPPGLTGNTWILQHNKSQDGKLVTDSRTFRMASVANNVTLYGHFYSSGETIEIYQGDTLFKTASAATELTGPDKTKMKSDKFPSQWFRDINFLPFSVSGGKVSGSFKISWTHNPANGRWYTIKIVNGNVWRYAIEYPIDADVVVCESYPETNPAVYAGTLEVTPSKFKALIKTTTTTTYT